MALIDTHAHLNDPQLLSDIPELIARAKKAAVTQVVAVGICLPSSRECVRISEEHREIHAAVGIHPNSAAAASLEDWNQIVDLAGHPRVVAIGETGLDLYRDHTPLNIQRDYFIKHITLSQQLRIPFIVHCRNAESEVLACLKEAGESAPLQGVLHSFTGTRKTAELAIQLGMYISFAGMLTFKNAEDLRSVARNVPLDRIMVETDSPYLAPVPVRGRCNEPSYVTHTASCLADLHGCSLEQISNITTDNAHALFTRINPS